MTIKRFISILKKKDYSYEIKGDKIIVTQDVHVYLSALTSLPPGVEFKNRGGVYLDSLTSLPPGVEFNNRGDVDLSSLTSLPPGVVFKNEEHVYLRSLTSISPGVKFNNEGYVRLNSLVGGWVDEWSGNIKGIESKRLLNLTIKQGMFI